MRVLDFGPIYTPTGNIAQIDYAQKAADNGSTVLAISTPSHILFAVEKPVESNLHILSENKRISKLTRNCVIVGTGLLSDMVFFNDIVRREMIDVESYLKGASGVGMRRVVARHSSEFTRYYGCRPLGVNMLSACVESDQIGARASKASNCPNDVGRTSRASNCPNDGTNNTCENASSIVLPVGSSVSKSAPVSSTPPLKLSLFVTDTSSKTREVRAYAIGKGAPRAKTELEKIDTVGLDRRGLIDNSVRILYKCFDPLKDKPFELEIGILGAYGYEEVAEEEYGEFVEAYKDLNVDDD